jgi:hypothetical protein
VVSSTSISTIEERARARARYTTGLLWHAGAFLIINAFFVLIDLMTGGGVNWALWIALPWGFALAFHTLAYAIDGRQVERRKTVEYMEEEQRIRDVAR